MAEIVEKQVLKAWANAHMVPREHQWKTCTSVINDLQENSSSKPNKLAFTQGVTTGKNYLIQHAAGSGKSLTIACLVVQLHNLKQGDGNYKFDKILIMNDRTQLDVQLGDVIVSFLNKNGISNCKRPKSSKELETDLAGVNNRIIVTTMQKFSNLILPTQPDSSLDGTEDAVPSALSNTSIAIISDEAHRSHGKQTTRHLHSWLGGTTRQSRSITYFSFTCTPTRKCLEMFGTPHSKTIKQPFYTYSMRDAIRDGLVLDVTQNYSTVVVLAKMTQVEVPSTPTSSDASTAPASTTPTPIPTPDTSSSDQMGTVDLPLENPNDLVVSDAAAATHSLDVTTLSDKNSTYQGHEITPVLIEDTPSGISSSSNEQSAASSCETSPASSAEGINPSLSSTPQPKVYLEARKAAYHVLRIPGADTGVLKEKARYMVDHLIKTLKEIDSPTFKGRAMIVTEGRKHILWYKHFIEEEIRNLGESFEVVAAFSPFMWDGKMYTEQDVLANGKFVDRQDKPAPPMSVAQLLKDDVNTKIRVLIAADKFQTGFDEPSLAVMYVDKRLSGAHCVQTLGRLSRVSPGKDKCYVVDFANSRREIADAFAAYWDTTTLQVFSRPEVLEIRLRKAAEKLLSYAVIDRGDIDECVSYILEYEKECKRRRYKPVIEGHMTLFLELCNRLQVDDNPKLKYKFVSNLLSKLRETRANASKDTFTQLMQSVQVSVEYFGESTGVSIKKKHASALTMKSPAARQILDYSAPMTGSQIIDTANQAHHRRVVDLMCSDDDDEDYGENGDATKWGKGFAKGKNKKTKDDLEVKKVIPVPELDASNLEFAKEIWRGGKSSESVVVSSDGVGLSSPDASSDDPTKNTIPLLIDPPVTDLELEHVHARTTQHGISPMDVDSGAGSDIPNSLLQESQYRSAHHHSSPKAPKRKSHGSDDGSFGVPQKRQCNETEESPSSTTLQQLQEPSTLPSPISFTDSMAQLNAMAFHFASSFNPTAACLFSENTAYPAPASTGDSLVNSYATLSRCLQNTLELLTNTNNTMDVEHGKAFVKILLDLLKMCSGSISSSEGNDFCVLILQTVNSICDKNPYLLTLVYDHPVTLFISLVVSQSSLTLAEEAIKMLTMIVTANPQDREHVPSFVPTSKAITSTLAQTTSVRTNPIVTTSPPPIPTPTPTSTSTSTLSPTPPRGQASKPGWRVRVQLQQHTSLTSALVRLAHSRYQSSIVKAAMDLRSVLLPSPSPTTTPSLLHLRSPSPSLSPSPSSSFSPSPSSSASFAPSSASRSTFAPSLVPARTKHVAAVPYTSP